MIVAIQQPEHLPWIGFFNKMAQVDLFVLLDNVQFKKRYFENRNRIYTIQGVQWVTVPVETKGLYTQKINEVEIAPTHHWQRKYTEALRHGYSRAECFDGIMTSMNGIIESHWARLIDLNIELISAIREMCGISTPVALSSEIGTDQYIGGDLILELCRRTSADVYVSGPDGRNYLQLEEFDAAGVEVVYHDFEHPQYRQLYEPFMSHMSVVDFLFNESNRELVGKCYHIPCLQKTGRKAL